MRIGRGPVAPAPPVVRQAWGDESGEGGVDAPLPAAPCPACRAPRSRTPRGTMAACTPCGTLSLPDTVRVAVVQADRAPAARQLSALETARGEVAFTAERARRIAACEIGRAVEMTDVEHERWDDYRADYRHAVSACHAVLLDLHDRMRGAGTPAALDVAFTLYREMAPQLCAIRDSLRRDPVAALGPGSGAEIIDAEPVDPDDGDNDDDDDQRTPEPRVGDPAALLAGKAIERWLSARQERRRIARLPAPATCAYCGQRASHAVHGRSADGQQWSDPMCGPADARSRCQWERGKRWQAQGIAYYGASQEIST